jgi:hypothetical protein
MPALPPVSKVIAFTLRGTLGPDTDVVNKFYCAYSTGTPTSAQLATACNTIATSWNTNMAPMVNPEYTLTEVLAEDLTSATGAVASVAVSHTGTRSGNLLPAGAAAVVQQKISRRYRGGHPRKYFYAGVTSDLLTDQQWGSAFITSLTTAVIALSNDIATAVGVFATVGAIVNVSYYAGFTNVLYPSGRYHVVPTRRAVPFQDLVLSYATNPVVGSQRRRNLQP